MARYRSMAVLATLILLAGLLAATVGPAVVAGDSSASASTPKYTIDELAKTGTQPDNRAPSTRWLGSYRSVFVDRKNTNPLKRGSQSEWAARDLLAAGETVNQRTLRFNYRGPRGGGNVSYTLHVVYWQTDTRTVTVNGTKKTEQYAVNVTHEEHTLEFSGAGGTSKVTLRPYYDQKVRVTMWIERYSESARWRFKYKTLPTSERVSTTTAGERLWWVIKEFVVWIVVFGFIAAALSLWAIKKAGAGPQMGFGAWAVIIGVTSFFAILFNYEGIATLFVRGPKILAFATVGLLTIPLLEGQDDRITDILAVKPVVTEATNTAGDEAQDALRVKMRSVKLTETSDGKTIFVTPGPLKFLARLFGAVAELDNPMKKLRTRVDADGKTRYSEVVWVNHQAEDVVTYDAEGFRWDWPQERLEVGVTMGVIAGVSAIAWGVFGPSMTWLGALAALPLVLETKEGEADIEPAPAHSRAAHVTAMYMTKEFKDAETLEESLKETYRERAKSSQEVEARVETRDETIVAEMLGGDVSATVTEEAGGDPADD